MTGYNPLLKCPAYDPNRARALLRQAGFSAGLPKPLKLWYPNTQIYRRWAQAIQADLAEVGVRIEPNGVTRAAFGEETSRRRTAELTLYGNNANVPDPSTFLIFFHSRFITEEDSQNNFFYSSPKVDALLDRAAVCIDEPHRLELYQQAEEMILDDVPMIVLGHQNLFALRQPWLKGPLLEPFWWFRFDRVWLER
jgi:ABC-type transport system substrate-binding protein